MRARSSFGSTLAALAVAGVLLCFPASCGRGGALEDRAAARGATASDAELRRYVADLLGASAEHADAMRVLDAPPDADALLQLIGNTRNTSYPSAQPAAAAARRALLAAGARSVPHVLAAIETSELDPMSALHGNLRWNWTALKPARRSEVRRASSRASWRPAGGKGTSRGSRTEPPCPLRLPLAGTLEDELDRKLCGRANRRRRASRS